MPFVLRIWHMTAEATFRDIKGGPTLFQHLRHMLSCLLLLVLLASLIPAAHAAQAPSAPQVRVLLRRLTLTDRADLTLQGPYQMESAYTVAAFPSGASIVCQIRGGEIVLFYGGMSIRVGKEIRFTRQASGSTQEGGLRFSDGGNLYPGDLALSVVGGQLQPILTLSVEDYLRGVVPYEMSNSFPLEALKAQAVCARTYALSHVDTSRAYDLVDTTNDQVYRGTSGRDTRSDQAVRETAGIVGCWNGDLTVCYYSASNGGQTELPKNVWAGSDAPSFYTVKEDPYDLENPESPVKRIRLRRDGHDLPVGLLETLHETLIRTIASKGFSREMENFRVDALDAVALTHQPFGDQSLFFDRLALTFRWSGRAEGSSAWMSAGEPVTQTLPLFPDLITGLGLSIADLHNEILSIREESASFVLESRRFGHGVGMSQRGAQQMAQKYSATFDQILSFYYPGMELWVIPSGDTVLPTQDPRLFSTPAPPATPTPRPTLMPVTGDIPDGAWLASVEGIDDDSSLNLRKEPHSAADILMRLYKHQQLLVLETCEDPAWVHVRTDSMEGYVMVSFLEDVTDAVSVPEADATFPSP